MIQLDYDLVIHFSSPEDLILTFISVNAEVQEHRVKSVAAVADIKPLPAEKMNPERLQAKNGSVKRIKAPITATSYTVASLQTATNSFSQECIVGEGSLGRVYRAEFPNGKVTYLIIIHNYKKLK